MTGTGSGARILLVDDEDSIHLLYGEELRDEGYEVVSAKSGAEALGLLPDVEPDLVILDINMPGMDGLEVLRRIKEQRSGLPVILSSAYPEFKQDISSWAADAYLVKISDLTELKETVRRLLGR